MLYYGIIEISYWHKGEDHLTAFLVPIRAENEDDARKLASAKWYEYYEGGDRMLRDLGLPEDASIFGSENAEVRISVASSMYPMWTAEVDTASCPKPMKQENTKGECE